MWALATAICATAGLSQLHCCAVQWASTGITLVTTSFSKAVSDLVAMVTYLLHTQINRACVRLVHPFSHPVESMPGRPITSKARYLEITSS